jgi:hypothetical protein
MKRQVLLVGFLALFLFSVLYATPACGQAVYGSIIGTVTDPQGAAVSGAKVTVTSATKNTSDEAITNESGNYTVTHLIPDTYNISVEAQGFKTAQFKNVVVSADLGTKVDAALEVGAISQTVEVSGEVPQLMTDRADVGVEFNQQYVQDLPVLNRNFTQFLLLSPGTQKLPGFNHAATENPQGGGQINVNGQHFSGTGYELDGTDNQDPILGIIVVNPNLEAITETKISLQDFDAEQGKAIAGLATVQTRSGTNEFHGAGFYFYRDSAQQARDPFTNKPNVPLPAATWKQFGGAVGGPIIKDKLFFFGDYQQTKQTAGITNLYSVPTSQVVTSCNPATNAQSATPGFCDLSQYLNAYGTIAGAPAGQIFNPATGNPLDGTGRTAFPNNQIPIGLVSANVGKVLALFPAPNTGPSGAVNNNYVASGSGPFNQYAWDTREDWSAPHGFQVFGRFSFDWFNLSGKGGLGALGSAGFGPGTLNGSSNVHNYSVAAGFNKTIGTRWLTDFRFGWFQYNPVTAYSDSSQTPMTNFGFPGLNIPGQPTTNGLSGFLFTNNGGNGFNGALGNPGGGTYAFGNGLDAARCNCPLLEREHQVQFVNNWTRLQGNHTIKFGADIRYATNLRVPSDQSRSGLLYFDQLGTGNGPSFGLGIATFLLGDVTQFQRFVSTTTSAVGHQWRDFFYGQDSWRVSPKFTFTYGLRWEIYTPEAVNGKGHGGFADLNNGTLRIAGYGPWGSNGNVANAWKAFAPRLGAAYQFDPRTVFRLGYGRSFDIGVFGSNFGHAVTQNLPVLAAQDIADSNITPAATNNRSAVFNLAQGPPAYPFSTVLADIGIGTPAGTLPLLGPDGATSAYIRPTKQRLPTVDAWNVSFQRQVTATLNLTISYIGNKGTHVFAGSGPSYNVNQIAVGSGTNIVVCSAPITPCPAGDLALGGFTPSTPANNRRQFFLNGVPSFTYPGSTFTTAGGQVLPTPPCCPGDVNSYFGNDASNEYNALQIKAEQRLMHGLQFLAHYTYSSAHAYNDSYFPIGPKFAWGPNPYNRKQVFVWSAIYDLPVGKGKMFLGNAGRVTDLLLGGWQASNTLTYGTGLPFNPSINECSTVTDAGPCRPNVTGHISTGTKTITSGCNSGGPCGVYWFTPVQPLSYNLTAADVGKDSCALARPVSGPLSLPACGQIGNMGFNAYWGPHAFYDDFSLLKTFNITERFKAQFRFDAYNLFNHPVLAIPGTQCLDCFGTASAGQITDIEADSAPGAPVGMRQLQFGFRVVF